jgi:hypothetical protein
MSITRTLAAALAIAALTAPTATAYDIHVVVVGLIVRWSARRAERHRRTAGARDSGTTR